MTLAVKGLARLATQPQIAATHLFPEDLAVHQFVQDLLAGGIQGEAAVKALHRFYPRKGHASGLAPGLALVPGTLENLKGDP